MIHEAIDSHANTEYLGNMDEFFAPASTDMVDGLVGRYNAMRKRVEEVAALLDGDRKGVINYFIEGNRKQDNSRYSSLSAEKIFIEEGAIAALNAEYWDRALKMTDVLDFMPQKRRSDWWEQIREMKTPDFTEETVRATLTELLMMRGTFLAERVDGIFRALSREHVTNRPEGFYKRMILNSVVTSYEMVNHDQAGHINDLRSVIAKFMGRDEPNWQATNRLIDYARRTPGERVMVDGGALYLKVFKKGTAHLEVHPEIAFRLNQVLAHLHPAAIPSQFRTPPKRKAKDFVLMNRPLGFAVLDLLGSMRSVPTRSPSHLRHLETRAPRTENPWAIEFDYGIKDKAALAEAEQVLKAIGGVKVFSENGAVSWFEFDYHTKPILDEIVASGCIPDHKSHQYYPTPERLASEVVELAEINDQDTVLEPSAGQGHIADMLPKDRTTCVELAALHCQVLAAKGFRCHQADFLEWANTGRSFTKIIMNPPYSQGRALHHLEAAASCLAPGGRLVAILPGSMRGKDLLPGWETEWTASYQGEFAGTGVNVTILVADKPDQ